MVTVGCPKKQLDDFAGCAPLVWWDGAIVIISGKDDTDGFWTNCHWPKAEYEHITAIPAAENDRVQDKEE